MNIKINTIEKSYDINIGSSLLDNAHKYFDVDRKVLIVSDTGVPFEYVSTIKNKIKNSYVLSFENGEEHKNIVVFKNILATLVQNNFTRTDAVIAVGGGVVGDMAAFASSCYMRGIDFYNVPTTLLSQVDSSIGGKTAIDFMGVKNIIGSFYQPSAVLIDIETLKTLDDRQLVNGFVESIKMAITFDKEFFEELSTYNDINDIRKNAESIIYKSLLIKKKVVEEDTKEKGIRKVLNFGHTIGHAIEESCNNKYLHGECVAVGMLLFSDDKIKNKLLELYTKFNIPSKIDFDKEKAIEKIKLDKKATGDMINVICCNEIGKYQIVSKSVNDTEKIIKEY